MKLLTPLRATHLTFIFVFLLFPATAFATYSFSVTVGQIQNALRLFFPLREYAADARLSLSEPAVSLRAGADDLWMEVPVVVSISGQARLRGRATVDVGLYYRAASGDLFLGNPRLRSFEMDGLTADRREALRASLADVLTNTLTLVRIYRVREQDLNHSLAKSEIKAIKIENDVLRVSIGFD